MTAAGSGDPQAIDTDALIEALAAGKTLCPDCGRVSGYGPGECDPMNHVDIEPYDVNADWQEW